MSAVMKEKKQVAKFYLEKEVRTELQQYAEWSGLPQSQVVASALAKHFATDKYWLNNKRQQNNG